MKLRNIETLDLRTGTGNGGGTSLLKSQRIKAPAGGTASRPWVSAWERRGKVQNAYEMNAAGAMGAGDRSAGSFMPLFTSNPYTSNDYLYRWRQFVMMYETSWEARKIINIIPEDALRKPWIFEGIPDEAAAQKMQHRLDDLGFLLVLKRSLKLERLLGGCITFLGLESEEDAPGRPYRVHEGKRLRFVNAIPLSRISRVSWDEDPLSPGYMRPEKYLVNGQDVHRSRCLIWDGQPLFDPMDMALTPFRANLTGFGPGKLAAIWDDIIKAVGTRQAAYQLILTNNAIIAAVQDLADLGGTTPGKKTLAQIEQMANTLSVYRAAIIDGEKVTLSQHSASFGSVPELLLVYLQVLAAASDIPATRFLGQAPGGLNATGTSDLENYYNVIDAYQQQDIVPKLRYVYDVLGYEMFPRTWGEWRKNLTFRFPPMWNASELEEAQRNQINLDNILKAREEGLISDERAAQELNAKGVLTVKLDEADIELMKDFKEENQDEPAPAPEAGIEALRKIGNKKFFVFQSAEGFGDLIRKAGGDPKAFDPGQVAAGLSVEQEHWDTERGDEVEIMKIVLDHLREDREYYTKLKGAGI